MVVKRQTNSQLNVLEKQWNVEFSGQAGTRREISGLELKTVSIHLSKVLLCLLIYSGWYGWIAPLLKLVLTWVGLLDCLGEVVGIWKPKLVLLCFRSEINRSQKQSLCLRASNFAFQLLSLCPLQKALGIVMEQEQEKAPGYLEIVIFVHRGQSLLQW